MAAATLPLTLMLTCGVQTMSDSEMEQLLLKNRTIQQAVRHCPDSGTVLHVTLPVMRAWLEVTKNQEDCVQLYGELMTTIKASEARVLSERAEAWLLIAIHLAKQHDWPKKLTLQPRCIGTVWYQ